jgi:hypothetical protein
VKFVTVVEAAIARGERWRDDAPHPQTTEEPTMPLFTTTLSLQPPSDLDLDVRYHRALRDEIAELEPDQLPMPCALTAGLYRIRVTSTPSTSAPRSSGPASS